MKNRNAKQTCRVDLMRMERAVALFDEELKQDAGPRAPYCIERWLKDDDQVFRKVRERALAKLVAMKCDAGVLQWRLMLCDDLCLFNGPPYHLPRTTLDKRIKAFRNCRDHCVDDSNFGSFLKNNRPGFEALISLQSTLDLYSELLLHFTENLGPQAHHYLDVSKSLVDKYVKQQTGRYRDTEVAILISGSVRRPYTKAAHRNWRSDYRKKIADFLKYEDRSQAKFREEKRLLEECAVKKYRSGLWDYHSDPDGTNPILQLSEDLAARLKHGMRAGDRVVALDGRTSTRWSRAQVAQQLKDRLWQAEKGYGSSIIVSIYRRDDNDPSDGGQNLRLVL